jgi:hypothetical protein
MNHIIDSNILDANECSLKLLLQSRINYFHFHSLPLVTIVQRLTEIIEQFITDFKLMDVEDIKIDVYGDKSSVTIINFTNCKRITPVEIKFCLFNHRVTPHKHLKLYLITNETLDLIDKEFKKWHDRSFTLG